MHARVRYAELTTRCARRVDRALRSSCCMLAAELSTVDYRSFVLVLAAELNRILILPARRVPVPPCVWVPQALVCFNNHCYTSSPSVSACLLPL